MQHRLIASRCGRVSARRPVGVFVHGAFVASAPCTRRFNRVFSKGGPPLQKQPRKIATHLRYHAYRGPWIVSRRRGACGVPVLVGDFVPGCCSLVGSTASSLALPPPTVVPPPYDLINNTLHRLGDGGRIPRCGKLCVRESAT